MPFRVLTDEHLPPTIGPDLAMLGYDVVPVHHRGLLGWEDWDLMAWCVREQRSLWMIQGGMSANESCP